jgi:hypothetical protein
MERAGMTEVEQQEFVGEVYWDGDAFTGNWSVRAGNRILESGSIKSLQRDGAWHHVNFEARERGFNWEG